MLMSLLDTELLYMLAHKRSSKIDIFDIWSQVSFKSLVDHFWPTSHMFDAPDQDDSTRYFFVNLFLCLGHVTTLKTSNNVASNGWSVCTNVIKRPIFLQCWWGIGRPSDGNNSFEMWLCYKRKNILILKMALNV